MPGTRATPKTPKRSGLRLLVGLGLWISACQTGHPTAVAIRPAAPPPVDAMTPVPGDPISPLLSPVPAAPDPMTLVLAAEAAVDPAADRAWIDALLQRRAPRLGRRSRAEVAQHVADAAARHGIDPLVVLSIIAHESRFDPHARGPQGGNGLMQLRPFVARDVAQRHGLAWHGDATLRDPGDNVAIGTAYLAEMLEKFGDLELALAAYNMGPYRLQRMLRRGDTPAGLYLGRVLSHYGDLAGLAASLETGADACTEIGC